MSQSLQKSPYLRTQRDFPGDNSKALAVQADRAYIETANAVNQRTIGLYALNQQIVTGNTWYLNGPQEKQQTLRQVYNFTATGNIPHNLNWSSVSIICPNSYGTYTDGTNWYGCIYGSSTSIAGQVSFYVTSTNIVIIAGSGAPSITNGYISLEWVSQV